MKQYETPTALLLDENNSLKKKIEELKGMVQNGIKASERIDVIREAEEADYKELQEALEKIIEKLEHKGKYDFWMTLISDSVAIAKRALKVAN